MVLSAQDPISRTLTPNIISAKLSRGISPNLEKTVDRAQKEKVVEELGQIFESSGVVVVAQYTGLTVAEMQDLRARAAEAEASVRVAKNLSLIHI